MKFLRYVTLIAVSIIIVPFLGIPTTWKQIIFVVLGLGLLITVAFLKKAILTCSHEEVSEESGSSFKDSEYKEVVIDLPSEQPEVELSAEDNQEEMHE